MKVNSIRKRLLLILLPFCLLSFAMLSGVSYYLSNQSLTKSMDETGVSVGLHYANRIQDTMLKKMIHLEDLASTASIRTGRNKVQIVEVMAEAKTRVGDFDALAFIWPDSTAVLSNGMPAQYGDREYFKKVLSTKKPYISNPVISKATGKSSVIMAMPVIYNGQVTGILVGTQSMEKLTDMLKELKFRETGYGFLVDKSGLVIGYPKLPEAAGKMKFTEKKINSELIFKELELDDNLISLFKSTIETGKQVQGKYKFDDVNVITIFTPIDLPGDQRWVIGVSAPEVEVTRESTVLARTMLLLSLVFIVLAIVFSMMISKRFVKPIQMIRDECILLTQGNLREPEVKIHSQDEIGQLAQGFKEMRTNLRGLVTKAQFQAEQVAASSEELTASAYQAAQTINQVAGAITEIAQGTDKQATSTTHIFAVSEELSASTEQVSATVRGVSEIAENTTQEAEQGRQAVAQVIDQIKQIGKGSESVNNAIIELAKGSQEISGIVNLISNIANQTNLLALNAAIEAARAGEQGRGFAVVAEEVRKLAEDSNQAAQQIGALIQRNQVNMDQAVSASKTGTEGVEVGVMVANSAGETFERIARLVIMLSSQIKEISESVNQMVSASQILVLSIHEIDKVSNDNASVAQTVSVATEEQAASMQEIASSSQSLAKTASDLQEAVARFRI